MCWSLDFFEEYIFLRYSLACSRYVTTFACKTVNIVCRHRQYKKDVFLRFLFQWFLKLNGIPDIIIHGIGFNAHITLPWS